MELIRKQDIRRLVYAKVERLLLIVGSMEAITTVTTSIDSIPIVMEFTCEPTAIQEVTCTTSSPKHDVSNSDHVDEESHQHSQANHLTDCAGSQHEETTIDQSQLAMDTSVEPDSSLMPSSDDVESRIMQYADRWSFDGNIGPVCFDYQSDYQTWSKLAWRFPALKLEYVYNTKSGYGEIWSRSPVPMLLYCKIANLFGYTLVNRIRHRNLGRYRYRYYGVGPCDVYIHGQQGKFKISWPDRGFEPIGLRVGAGGVLPRSIHLDTLERYGTTPLPTLVLEMAWNLENEAHLIQQLMNWVTESSVQIAVGILIITPEDEDMIWPINAYVVRNETKVLEKFSTLTPSRSILRFRLAELFHGLGLPFIHEVKLSDNLLALYRIM